MKGGSWCNSAGDVGAPFAWSLFCDYLEDKILYLRGNWQKLKIELNLLQVHFSIFTTKHLMHRQKRNTEKQGNRAHSGVLISRRRRSVDQWQLSDVVGLIKALCVKTSKMRGDQNFLIDSMGGDSSRNLSELLEKKKVQPLVNILLLFISFTLLCLCCYIRYVSAKESRKDRI